MLEISRGKDEEIVIGDSIILTVVEIDGDTVRLAIEHPDGVSVRTAEVVAAATRAVEQPQAQQ